MSPHGERLWSDGHSSGRAPGFDSGSAAIALVVSKWNTAGFVGWFLAPCVAATHLRWGGARLRSGRESVASVTYGSSPISLSPAARPAGITPCVSGGRPATYGTDGKIGPTMLSRFRYLHAPTLCSAKSLCHPPNSSSVELLGHGLAEMPTCHACMGSDRAHQLSLVGVDLPS